MTTDDMNILVTAMQQQQLVELSYVDKKGALTNRVVEPYEIKGSTYFYGWDVAKGSIRSFLMTQIQAINVLPETFSPRYPIKINER